jgi:hypothetical protein
VQFVPDWACGKGTGFDGSEPHSLRVSQTKEGSHAGSNQAEQVAHSTEHPRFSSSSERPMGQTKSMH